MSVHAEKRSTPPILQAARPHGACAKLALLPPVGEDSLFQALAAPFIGLIERRSRDLEQTFRHPANHTKIQDGGRISPRVLTGRSFHPDHAAAISISR